MKGHGKNSRSAGSEWAQMKAAEDAILRRLVHQMESGVAPDAAVVMDVAEEARRHIDEWFYPCSHQMHANLSAVYATDAAARARYEAVAEGLSDYLVAAIRANLRRHGNLP